MVHSETKIGFLEKAFPRFVLQNKNKNKTRTSGLTLALARTCPNSDTMKDVEYKRLLLYKASKDSSTMECLDLIQKANLGYIFGQAIPADEVWDIYSRRKAWNENASTSKRARISAHANGSRFAGPLGLFTRLR
jgi:hypothetical protein